MAKKTTRTTKNLVNKDNVMLFLSALGCVIMGYQLHLTQKQLELAKKA